jgi:hypothetical protein
MCRRGGGNSFANRLNLVIKGEKEQVNSPVEISCTLFEDEIDPGIGQERL